MKRNNNYSFNYEPELTGYLDNIGYVPFDKTDIYKITLWKVARVPHISDGILNELNSLAYVKSIDDIKEKKHIVAVLQNLLKCKGVRLPMASTYLRFRNPTIFQIIDRHVWYQVYHEEYVESSNIDVQVSKYLDYLRDLRNLSKKEGVKFFDADRYFYMKDKKEGHKLKY